MKYSFDKLFSQLKTMPKFIILKYYLVILRKILIIITIQYKSLKP